MKEITILKNDAGIRFDKYLKRLLSNAGNGFIYKMLRKKNITLNNQKADGKEFLKEGDTVKLFFSDETFDKFTKGEDQNNKEYLNYKNMNLPALDIIFEDEDMILLNKPKNLLSQKAKADDISANELLIAYMVQKGLLSEEEFVTFHPSVCNRLDQNTTGLLIFGKTRIGLQKMSAALKNRLAHKYYRAIVVGRFENEGILEGYLTKNEANNTVRISKVQRENSEPIKTGFQLLSYDTKKDLSYIEIELYTGKPHQIRAHLAQIGNPILGDYKYGIRDRNDAYKAKYGISSQLLHAYCITIPEFGKFEAPLPEEFRKVLDQG